MRKNRGLPLPLVIGSLAVKAAVRSSSSPLQIVAGKSATVTVGTALTTTVSTSRSPTIRSVQPRPSASVMLCRAKSVLVVSISNWGAPAAAKSRTWPVTTSSKRTPLTTISKVPLRSSFGVVRLNCSWVVSVPAQSTALDIRAPVGAGLTLTSRALKPSRSSWIAEQVTSSPSLFWTVRLTSVMVKFTTCWVAPVKSKEPELVPSPLSALSVTIRSALPSSAATVTTAPGVPVRVTVWSLPSQMSALVMSKLASGRPATTTTNSKVLVPTQVWPFSVPVTSWITRGYSPGITPVGATISEVAVPPASKLTVVKKNSAPEGVKMVTRALPFAGPVKIRASSTSTPSLQITS